MARHIGSKPHINTAIMVGDHTPEHLLHLMGVFTGLEEQDKLNIDMACADFAAHVKGMGPASALELAGCLGEWLAKNPEIVRSHAHYPKDQG